MLIPREHGAYGQLLFPLVCALLVGHPQPGAYLLAAAALAAFLAHESLLVVLGQRGSRSLREQGTDARRSLALFGGFCAVTGAVALAVLPRVALVSLLLPALLGAVVAALVFAHRERSTVGEMVVATALASVSLSVALAGAVSRTTALTLFVVFSAVFISATVSVRSAIGRVSKAGGPAPALAAVVVIAIVAGLFAAARAGALAQIAPYASLPVCIVALVLAIKPPSPRYLREIGWTLVGATALTAVVLVAALA